MRLFLSSAVALLSMLLPGSATAQSSYPDKSIRILVGFTPGTAPDLSGRIVADKMSESWGKPVVVENVTGAGGNIALDRVAKAPPDGYSLVMAGNGSLVIAPSLYDKLPYDPVKDLVPIVRIFAAPNILVVHPDVRANSIAELLALARSNPGKLTYGHAGIGTSQHLAGELFKYMAKIDIQPVAYRGSTAVVPDLLAGRLTMFFGNAVNVLPLLREGKVRGFAVTSLKRSSAAPDLPTMAESGFPGFEASPWFGLMAPAGTQQSIIEKLNAEARRILTLPETRKRFAELGIEPIGDTPADFAEAIRTETPQWANVIKQAGIKISEER